MDQAPPHAHTPTPHLPLLLAFATPPHHHTKRRAMLWTYWSASWRSMHQTPPHKRMPTPHLPLLLAFVTLVLRNA